MTTIIVGQGMTDYGVAAATDGRTTVDVRVAHVEGAVQVARIAYVAATASGDAVHVDTMGFGRETAAEVLQRIMT